MFRSALMAFAWLCGTSGFVTAAQDEKRVPTELVQYVRDARKAGLKPPQIVQNALGAGWSAAIVTEAVGTGTAASGDAASGDAASAAKAAEAPPVANPEGLVSVPKTAAAEPGGTPKPAQPATGQAPLSAAVDAAPSLAKPAEGSGNSDYEIGEGDIVQVAVWGEPTASVQSATVRPDGKISMPLIKEVQVSGLTPSQVEKQIQEQLGKIIRTPDVTVIVVQINSKKIYLTGAVKREGPLKFSYRMTVLQAISEAGGLTDYAKRKEIYVLHTETGRQYKLPFNYRDVLKGEHMEQNILLSPGDTIVVP